MDPALESVLLGVVANGLYSIVVTTGARFAGAGRRTAPEDDSVERVLREAIVKATEDFEWQAPPRLEIVCLFLGSPEAETIVRQIFSSMIWEQESTTTLHLARRQFSTALAFASGADEPQIRGQADGLFGLLLRTCEEALNKAIGEGFLAAHEVKSGVRHRLLMDELAAIRKNLDFLAHSRDLSMDVVTRFEKAYRHQVGERHGFIIPPHFDEARKVNIDSLYVSPNILPVSKSKTEQGRPMTLKGFLRGLYRAVLIGDPGAGKSTLSSKVCSGLSVSPAQFSIGSVSCTPSLVVLREYGAQKKDHGYSILQYIESTCNSRYQLQPRKGVFEYLLLNRRAVVIFDGLDELLDTTYRQEISADVESFCTLYPAVPVLVTSRRVGYEQAPLDERRFDVFQLAPFDEDQVKDYASKWFSVDLDLTREQQRQLATGFLQESRIVRDIRSNPLMLALMCNIYRGENYIPRNRPDVYEKCALMLFERWDKSRGIHVALPYEAHLRPTMKYLAYWIYGNDDLQSGVTEDALVAEATRYLCPRRIDDCEAAESVARSFVEFCRGRAWVFTDTGTTRDGKKLYQFTHRTFLEYFAADYISRTHTTPEALASFLLPRIAKREWDVVAQLSFQLKNNTLEGAADELLQALIERGARVEGHEAYNVLSFAARCLEFMIPSPDTTKSVTAAAIRWCISWAATEVPRRGGARRDRRAEPTLERALELLAAMFNCAFENRASVSQCLETNLTDTLSTGSDVEAIPALEVLLNFHLPLSSAGTAAGEDESQLVYWVELADRILDKCAARVSHLRTTDIDIALQYEWRHQISVAELTARFGAAALFRGVRTAMFPGIIWTSAAGSVLHEFEFSLDNRSRAGDDRELLARLGEIGHALTVSPAPWVSQSQVEFLDPFDILIDRRQNRLRGSAVLDSLASDPQALFGLFAILATGAEVTIKYRGPGFSPLDGQRRPSRDPLAHLERIIAARFVAGSSPSVEDDLQTCGFSPQQDDLVRRWSRREVAFVRTAGVRGPRKRHQPVSHELG